MKKFIVIALLCSTLGCMDADVSQITSIGSPHKVTLWSGGQAAKVWHSTGKVKTEQETDGWFFTDKATGKLVRVSGTISVEQE